MGFKISWVGFRGIEKAEVLQLLGAADTGIPDDANETPFSGAEIPDGWFILFANDFGFVSQETLKTLSRTCEVVACQVHEGVMVSTAYGYEMGSEQWSLTHFAEDGLRDLNVSGAPPAQFENIRARLFKEQDLQSDAVDCIFDIPLETAQAVCGYKHDRWKFDWGEPRFTEIKPV